MLDVPDWPGHLAGQHMDVRLTADDGYSTQRSHSIASAPGSQYLELTVQRLPGGEVSPYLVHELAPAHQLELRGPVGGWFVWEQQQTEPVLLVAGGSGVVPLMSMVRARETAGSRVPIRLLNSVRRPSDLLYGSELRRGAPGLDKTYLYTRDASSGSPRTEDDLGGPSSGMDQAGEEPRRDPACRQPDPCLAGCR
ncbi:FAD-binding oxidoreductase [Streptomyces sp. NPDC003393]